MKDFTEIRNKYCKDCWAIRFCRTCYIFVSGENGLNGNNLINECEKYSKKAISNNLKRYIEIMEENKQAFSKFRERIVWDEYFLM